MKRLVRTGIRPMVVALPLALALAALAGATQAEMRLQQGLVRALGAEREALRHVRALALAPQAAAPDTALRYDRDWLLARPAPRRSDAEFVCLTEAIYHEARGESVAGQFAVAEVILNRVDSDAYPNTICGVVYQNAHRWNACQFSFACNGRSRAMRDPEARAIAARIADMMMSGAARELTDGATHFHSTAVRPAWSRSFERTARFGTHIFYRQPARLASN